MRPPSEYLQHRGIIAYAIIHPEGDTATSRAGDTDLSILRATDAIARLSDDGCAMVFTGKCAYRARFVRNVGTVATCHEIGNPIAKSMGRMVDRALAALDKARPDTDDEPTQVYHPGASVLMTPANDSPVLA